jgi:hypothetical protein
MFYYIMAINNLPELHDILAEPSVEVLTDYAQKHRQTRGKFIRIGGIILVAPSIEIAGRKKYPLHVNMTQEAYHHPDQDLARRCRQAAEDTDPTQGLSQRPDLMDAGHYYTVMSAAGLLTAVMLDGRSMDFDRANDSGRQESGRIMQEYLQDPSVVVTST